MRIAELAAAMFDGPFGSALKTSDYTDEGVRVARLENIGRLKFRGELRSFVSPAKAESLRRHLLQRGDVLFSSFVDQETRVCLVPDELDGKILNKADCFCVRTDREICDPKFLAYKLASRSSYDTFSSTVRGITRPRIGLRDLANFTIELAPLAEQRRIVAKLDMLFMRLGLARNELDRTLNLVSRWRKALLSAAFEGKFGNCERPENVPCDRYIESTFYGPRFGKDEYVSNGVPTVRTTDFNGDGTVSLDGIPQVTCSSSDFAKWSLKDGDLLVTRTGSIGKCALYNADYGPMLPSAYLIRVRFTPDLLSRFAWMMFASPQGQAHLGVSSRAVTQPNINASAIRSLPIPSLAVMEQQRTVEAVDRFFARAARLEVEAARARALLDRMEAAILVKAFRGELVRQNPNDEPANALLDRIKAGRSQQVQSQARRGRKASVPKAPREKAVMTKSREDEDVRNKPYLANIIRQAGGPLEVEDLFKKADLPVTDFYKQLAWEVDQGHIHDQNNQTLQAA